MGDDLRENHAQEFVPNGEEKGNSTVRISFVKVIRI
jgi:hypothetical protein